MTPAYARPLSTSALLSPTHFLTQTLSHWKGSFVEAVQNIQRWKMRQLSPCRLQRDIADGREILCRIQPETLCERANGGENKGENILLLPSSENVLFFFFLMTAAHVVRGLESIDCSYYRCLPEEESCSSKQKIRLKFLLQKRIFLIRNP